MTPHGLAHLIDRINGFTTLEALRGWWDSNIGLDGKTDPQVVEAKDARKAKLT